MSDPHDDDDVFDYQVTKAGKVLIYWNDRRVTTLANKKAAAFLRKLDQGADEQQLMARFTGNFKRGNEREGKEKRG